MPAQRIDSTSQKRSRFVYLTALLFLALFGSVAQAAQPRGIAGLVWGDSPQAAEAKMRKMHFSDMEHAPFSQQQDGAVYIFRNGTAFGRYTHNALLLFHRNRLYSVLFDFGGDPESTFPEILSLLEEQFGPPTGYGDKPQPQPEWQVDGTDVALSLRPAEDRRFRFMRESTLVLYAADLATVRRMQRQGK